MQQQRKRSAPLRIDKVEELRQSRGLSIEQVAGKTGVDLRNVRRWFAGGRVYLKNIAQLAAVLGTTSEAIRADLAEPSLPAKPEKPCRFVIQIRLKGSLRLERHKKRLVSLTQDVVQALAREGITVTGQQSTWATSSFAGPAIWRILLGLPALSDGRPSWMIVAVRVGQLPALIECQELRSDHFNQGELIACGWGRKVPSATLRRVARVCRCNLDDVLDLTSPLTDLPTR